jgi:hypothetical protein
MLELIQYGLVSVLASSMAVAWKSLSTFILGISSASLQFGSPVSYVSWFSPFSLEGINEKVTVLVHFLLQKQNTTN